MSAVIVPHTSATVVEVIRREGIQKNRAAIVLKASNGPFVVAVFSYKDNP